MATTFGGRGGGPAGRASGRMAGWWIPTSVRNEDVRCPSAPVPGQTRPAVKTGRGLRMGLWRRGSAADGTGPRDTAGREPRAGTPHDDHRKPAERAVWRPHIQTSDRGSPNRPLFWLIKLAQSLARADAHVRFAPDPRRSLTVGP